MQENIARLAAARVLIVGDVMLDSYWHGQTLRISPEAPVPVVKVEEQERRVGGAGNVALNAAVLGATTHLLGLAGHDSAADQIESMLEKNRVRVHLQRVVNSSTITKMRILSRNQQLIRLDFEDEFPEWDPEALMCDFRRCLSDVDVVILSDYAKGALRRSREMITACRRAEKIVIVDPKGEDFERYHGASLITPNLSEFEAVVGRCESDAEIEQRGIALRDHLELDAILVTRSEKGMTLLERGQAPMHLPTRAQDVYDVTGAGDTVVATLGAALSAGMSLRDAVTLSNIAAGIVVAKLGTATVALAELEQALHQSETGNQFGLCTEDALAKRVAAARERGERIVMTNGCFDILHLGHIDYLEKARALGDRLIVAVNDDDSVRRLKGEARPLNPLHSRMRMLAALSSVDWVVSFSEDTPERLICKMMPDILVKGGDYSADQVAGGECVQKAGGEVRILEFMPGHSTTSLINKIQGSQPTTEKI